MQCRLRAGRHWAAAPPAESCLLVASSADPCEWGALQLHTPDARGCDTLPLNAPSHASVQSGKGCQPAQP